MNSEFCATTLIEHQGITWIQACDADGSADLHRSEVEIPQPIAIGEELPPFNFSHGTGDFRLAYALSPIVECPELRSLAAQLGVLNPVPAFPYWQYRMLHQQLADDYYGDSGWMHSRINRAFAYRTRYGLEG